MTSVTIAGRTFDDDRARTVIEQLKAMPLLDVENKGFQEQGERIARLCGDFNTFQALDEIPGYWPGSYASEAEGAWHVKLRRARNSCSRFFDALTAEEWDRDLEADRQKGAT